MALFNNFSTKIYRLKVISYVTISIWIVTRLKKKELNVDLSLDFLKQQHAFLLKNQKL